MARLLSVLCLVTVLAIGTATALMAQDGPRVNWKLATWGKPRAATVSVEVLKKHVEEGSGGRFTVTIGYESFGGPKELVDLLKVGSVQATQFCSSYHPEKMPAYSALDLPFLPVADADAQQRVHEAFHAHPYVAKELAAGTCGSTARTCCRSSNSWARGSRRAVWKTGRACGCAPSAGSATR